MKKTKIPALWNLLSSEVRQMTNNHSKQHVRKQDVLWKKAKPEDASSTVLGGRRQQRRSGARPGEGEASGLTESLLTGSVNRESIHAHF